MANDRLYFAQKPSDEAILVLQDKTEKWFQNIETTGYLDLVINSWTAYHGAYYNEDGGTHAITFGGEQGELTQIAVNHYRNIARNMLNIITATRPSMNAQAVNTDQKSISQTLLANNLLDYYMADHKLEEFIKTATEEAIVMASGYVMVEWDSTKGEVYDVDDITGEEIRQGDLEFTSVNMLNVVFDTNREDRKHDWVVVRTFKNRFDVAAKYPEHEEKILDLPTKSDLKQFSGFNSASMDETDLIPVYRFFHKRTDSMPEGRYLMYLDHDITLLDSPMPYRDLPVYCIAPSYYLGTVYPYSEMFDLLPLQDMLNSVYSTMLTNITTFGVQHLVVPNQSNVSISELSSGLSVISSNDADGVRGLNLTTQPDGIFDVIAQVVKDMETISGVNAVSRGNPDPSLRSGNALALVQSMTLQFLSGLQASYVLLIENLGTGIINILKDHATVPRIANIVGKNKKSYIKEFTGDSLSSVDRVKVKIGNPLANSTAGKVEMAEQLLQMGVIDNTKDYISVMETGNLDVMTEDVTSQLNLIRAENENMMDGKPVRAIFTDAHAMHIKEHCAVINDTDLRQDNDLVARVSAHIQEHIDLLRSTDPDILNMIGEVPLPPVAPPPQMGPPPGAEQGAPPAPEQQGPPQGGPPMQQTDPLSQQMAMPQNPLPNPPSVNPELLPNPELQVQQQATLAAMQPGPR